VGERKPAILPRHLFRGGYGGQMSEKRRVRRRGGRPGMVRAGADPPSLKLWRTGKRDSVTRSGLWG